MYTALYRKLRPKAFKDVWGQEHIVKTLQNSIINQRISHAYLFCGIRGTGKTSCAKIFAKAVNCESPIDGEACCACQPCIDIARGANMDVIEIDAASNNGVDNIRDLREEIKYPPQGKYKVYIIDEVHMLSTGAFNALLKTLEEPPAHIIFILATTDPQKIPATIHSRVMRFDFYRVPQNLMIEALRQYTAEEGIKIADDALEYIVQISDGSMRDVLSLLDRLAGLYFEEEITLAGTLEVTGSVDKEIFSRLLLTLTNRDAATALDIIDEASMKGRNFSQFAEEFVAYLRQVMIDITTASTRLEGLTTPEIIKMIGHFASSLRNIKQASSGGRLILEIACMEWISMGQPALYSLHAESLVKPLPLAKPVSEPAKAVDAPSVDAPPAPREPQPTPQSIVIEPKPQETPPAPPIDADNDWGHFAKYGTGKNGDTPPNPDFERLQSMINHNIKKL